MGVFMMYFNFLQDRIVDWVLDDEGEFNWSNVRNKFIRINTLSTNEIAKQEERLTVLGYHFPKELKAFWSEIGCGYLCPDDFVDNGLERPNTVLDIYLNEGDWANIKLNCNIIDKNELPFFLINDLDYITIGLEEGVNLGKIYRFGEEIAPTLTDFVQQLLQDATYYNRLLAIV